MLKSLSEIITYSSLSIQGTFDDQTRLQLINVAHTSYLNLRGYNDAVAERLNHAVRLATIKSWQNFFDVVTWAIEDLTHIEKLESTPAGLAIRG